MNKELFKKTVRDTALEYFNLFKMTGEASMNWEKEMDYIGEHLFARLKELFFEEKLND